MSMRNIATTVMKAVHPPEAHLPLLSTPVRSCFARPARDWRPKTEDWELCCHPEKTDAKSDYYLLNYSLLPQFF